MPPLPRLAPGRCRWLEFSFLALLSAAQMNAPAAPPPKRIRAALQLAFREAGLELDPQRVLVSERTVGNEVGYRLRATVEWVHNDVFPKN